MRLRQDTDKGTYYSKKMILHCYTGHYIDVHLYLRCTITITGLLGKIYTFHTDWHFCAFYDPCEAITGCSTGGCLIFLTFCTAVTFFICLWMFTQNVMSSDRLTRSVFDVESKKN